MKYAIIFVVKKHLNPITGHGHALKFPDIKWEIYAHTLSTMVG